MASQYVMIQGDKGSPNLDCMDVEELREFWLDAGGRMSRPLKKARELFPSRRTGYLKVTRSLGNYAVNKAAGIKCRLRGDVSMAIKHERICDRIHMWLPTWARW